MITDIENKAIELSLLTIELHETNKMLDDFSTETLARFTPKLKKIEFRMLELALEIEDVYAKTN
jgi:hypothetical protein